MTEQMLKQWWESVYTWLIKQWGLAPEFGARIALLLMWGHMAGLQPVVISGFRDPKKQAAMRERWDRGDRAGLAVRPAETSTHTTVDLSGKPAAQGVDIQSLDNSQLGSVAQRIGLRWGGNFRTPDPNHFDFRG